MFTVLRRITNLPARPQAETAQNRAHVALDRVLADLQRGGDLAIACAAPDELRDLALPARERGAALPSAERRSPPASCATSSRIASFVQRACPSR